MSHCCASVISRWGAHCYTHSNKQAVTINHEPLSGAVTTVYPKKYAHGFCFAVLCCGYTLTDFPISIRLTSLALWHSNDCLSASKATLMNMDKYFMWIHYERLHNHNKAKHNKTVCIFLGIYCTLVLLCSMILLSSSCSSSHVLVITLLLWPEYSAPTPLNIKNKRVLVFDDEGFKRTVPS